MLHRLILITISLILISCAATPSATPTNVATNTAPAPTNTVAPTRTSVATLTPVPPTAIPTATPKPTPYADLTTKGSYFVYERRQNDQAALVIMDADGSGRKVFPLPPNTVFRNLKESISPDGKWLVLHTGTAGEWDFDETKKYDLTLQLVHIPDGKIIKIADILSSDYPNNFLKLQELLAKQYPNYFRENDPKTRKDMRLSNERTFLGGIQAFAWSPDSRHLAFSGGMDGPSSDLYIYDLETNSIRRLTDGIQHVQSYIYFSDDGQWIHHTSAWSLCEGQCSTFYRASLDGTKVETLQPPPFRGNGFSSPIPPEIKYDGWTGVIDRPYDDSRPSHAYNSKIKTAIIVNTHNLGADDIKHGIYLVNEQKKTYMLVVEGDWDTAYNWGTTEYPFLVEGPNRVIAISAEGKFIDLNTTYKSFSISPDKKRLVFYSTENSSGMDMFDEKAQLISYTNDLPVTKIIWREDSKGAFFQANTSLYYVDVTNGKPVLLDNGFSEKDYFNYMWLTSK